MQQIFKESLIDTKELCNRLGVTRQAIYKWRKMSDPMPVKVDNTSKNGKTIRYLYSDVLNWLNEKKRKSEVLR